MKMEILLLIFLCCIQFSLVASIDHIVGGENGWTIPKKDAQFYNLWASQNRFNVNDTLYFKYKKDSVMVVSEEEYKKCRGVHPLFFSNNGDTVYVMDRAGLFYFISGINGHCERGQKMIIKVLELPHHIPPTNNNIKNGSIKTHLPISSTIIVLLTFSFLQLIMLLL